jgi:mannitol-specific phosphotransferase system IIBC component
MSVQIHINGESAEQVIEELSTLAKHLNLSAGTAVATEAPKTNTRTRSTAKAAETVKDEVKDTGEGSDLKVDPDTVDDSKQDDESVVTVEELRAKAGDVAKSGKQAEVKALLIKFEAASISAVPESDRAEFLKALEAL